MNLRIQHPLIVMLALGAIAIGSNAFAISMAPSPAVPETGETVSPPMEDNAMTEPVNKHIGQPKATEALYPHAQDPESATQKEAASGQASGKRTHKPLRTLQQSAPKDPSSPTPEDGSFSWGKSQNNQPGNAMAKEKQPKGKGKDQLEYYQIKMKDVYVTGRQQQPPDNNNNTSGMPNISGYNLQPAAGNPGITPGHKVPAIPNPVTLNQPGLTPWQEMPPVAKPLNPMPLTPSAMQNKNTSTGQEPVKREMMRNIIDKFPSR